MGPVEEQVELVRLDRDHPGFRDAGYRDRRNAIAALALAHREGDPVPRITYSPEEHQVWETALEHLEPLHLRYACEAFRIGWPKLGFIPSAIPQFEALNPRLWAATGFRLVPVAGLVTPAVFMTRLAGGEFLATQYMRHHTRPLYTPEPDVIHELVGHAALLVDPVFAQLNRKFGEATLRASPAEIDALIRVYWFTLEFGVARSSKGLEVVGAGLLSSFGELGRLETHTRLVPFDLDVMAATPFDPTDYQSTLFVAPTVDSLVRDLSSWLDQRIGRSA